jgi:cytochrome c553
MRRIYLILLLMLHTAHAADFATEARKLASDLRTQLMQKLNQQITQGGVAQAVPFCHAQVKPIAKGAAAGREEKYEFGRTSHRVRNAANEPQAWMKPYLERFKGTTQQQGGPITGKLEDGKNFYLEPVYMQPLCLNCHGEKIKPEVEAKISSLYPQDQARGFKLNEFRGFIWVKEK